MLFGYSAAESPMPVDEVSIDLSLPVSPEEKRQAIVEIYNSFIAVHSINEEGEFVPGGSSKDSMVTFDYFKHYVSKSPIKKTIVIARRCKRCLGSSKLFEYADPANAAAISKIEKKCPDCPSDGLVATKVTFTIYCPTISLPRLPEKPRVVNQRALIGRALAGDPVSQVEYAKQLEIGAIGVEKDLVLSRELFSRALVNGSGYGLDGLVRVMGHSESMDVLEARVFYALRLLQAKVEKERLSADASFGVYPDELGITAPRNLSYMDAKVAELIARSLNSNRKSRDLKPVHLTKEGYLTLLSPLKKQFEKSNQEAARAKVEFVLVDYALSKPGDGFGLDRLALVKQAAVSLDPVAFGILGDICERGLLGRKNLQAASIFYSISKKIFSERTVSIRLDEISSKYESSKTIEMLEEFQKTKVSGRANINYIEAVLRLENHQ